MKMSSKLEISKELNDSIRQILGRNVRISFKCPVRMEIKGDKTDNKILAFSACRLFVMSTKIPSKVEFHFHYLEIRSLDSRNPNHLCIEVGEKYYTFYTQDSSPDLVDQIVLQLNVSIKSIFPSISIDHVIKKIDFVPPSRFQNLTEHARFQENKECGPCGGFSAQYAWMCDFHGLPYRDEVAWDVDTIYLSQDTRELCLQDFDHLEPRDLIPIISALVYNRWFTKLKSSNIRLTSEAAEQIIRVLRKSVSVEEIYLDNMGLRWDYVQKLSQALVANPNSSVHTLDFSNNFIEDKGILHLVNALIKLPKGLIHLNLAKTGLTAKGVNTLANGLSVNKFMSSSLTYLNLADNTLKDDVTNLYNFLAQPNTLSHLDLSGTDIALDMLFGALLRGCSQKLSHLNLSRNIFSHKKPRDIVVPTSFKQFFTSTIGLKYLNLSSTKLPADALKNVLLGLAFNVAVKDVELDLSCNNLGSQGAHVLELCIADVHGLVSLDLSENALETDLASVITAIGRNKSLRSLAIGRNFNNIKSKHMKNIIEAFVQIIQDDDSVIEHLSLADSKLKSDIYCIINALGSNQCLMSVDISGNQMGDNGARLLAKALQINTRLKALFYDRNNITANGFCDLAYALQSNYTVRYMPYPIFDVCLAMKTHPEKTDAAMKRIENLLHRNVSPKKFSHSQAFRLQQGFLLSSTQQMVDRLVVQTQDTIKTLKHSQLSDSPEWLSESEACIQDADKSKQLLTRLHDVILQREETGNPVEQKLNQWSEELQHIVHSYLEESVDSMLKCAEDQCPKVLHDTKLLQDLKTTSRLRSKIPNTFVHQTIVEQAGTDVLNKINELNLAVASHISDRIVDEVIEALSKNHKSLITFANNVQNSTPDVLLRRTRLGSDLSNECSDKDDNIQDTPEISSKRKSVQTRKLRPQSVVDIPEDLIVDGPPDLLLTEIKTIHSSTEDVFPQRLQHLGKARPKRQKTKAPSRPNLRTDTILEDEQNLNEGLDIFFQKSESSITLSSLSELKSNKKIITKQEKAKEKLESKKLKEKSSDSDKEKKEKSGRLVQGLSNMFSRRSSDRSSKTKTIENPSDKSKHDTEPLSPALLSNKEVDVNKSDSPAVDSAFCQPSAIPRVGVGGNVLAEMKARQEKRLSLHKEQLDVLEKENRLSFSPKLSPSLSKLAENDVCTTNGIGNRTSPLFADEKRLSETFAKKSEPVPILKTSPSSSSHAYSSTAGKSSDRGNSPKTIDVDSVSPINKRALSGKPKPPPIAPKPRPRSMISPDFRKSGEFSPGSDVSSLDGSTGTTPERGDLQDDSIDSGLMGSRDSLSPRELTPDSSLSPDVETIRRKAASLPRTATPDMVNESPRGRSYSYREILNNSNDNMSQGGHRPVSLPPESGILQIRNKSESKTLLAADYHVDDIVNV